MVLQVKLAGRTAGYSEKQIYQLQNFILNGPIWCHWLPPPPPPPPPPPSLTTRHLVYRQIFLWKFFPHLISALAPWNESHNLKMNCFQALTGSSDIIAFLPNFLLASFFFFFKFAAELLSFQPSNILSLSQWVFWAFSLAFFSLSCSCFMLDIFTIF